MILNTQITMRTPVEVVIGIATHCVLFAARETHGKIIDVRLVNGSSQYEGTVEVTKDGSTWLTTCGRNLDYPDAKLICTQLNFSGANRHIQESPFGSSLAPTIYLQCTGGEQALDQCPYRDSCNGNPHISGAVKCYDERYLGCYTDSTDARVLPNGPCPSTPCQYDDLTIDKCIELCQSVNGTEYALAGVEFTNECFCGDNNTRLSELVKLPGSECLHVCSGSKYESCGGQNAIAVFKLLSYVSSNNPVTSEPSQLTSLNDYGLTENLVLSTIPTSESQGTSPLHIGVGAGGVVLAIIIITVIVVICKQRNRNKQNNSVSLNMDRINIPENGNSNLASPDEEASNGFTVRSGVVLNMYGDHTPGVKSRPYDEVDSSGLYAMPDISPMTSHKSNVPARSRAYDTSGYVSPDEVAGMDMMMEGEEDFGDLYATSAKHRPEPEGANVADAGDLYATPDKKMDSKLSGRNHEDVAALYAMPDKKRSVMVENELYSSQ